LQGDLVEPGLIAGGRHLAPRSAFDEIEDHPRQALLRNPSGILGAEDAGSVGVGRTGDGGPLSGLRVHANTLARL
jgi:hypothetical protein